MLTWAWAVKTHSPAQAKASRRGRKNDNAWVRARGVKYFMVGTQSSNNPCRPPRQRLGDTAAQRLSSTLATTVLAGIRAGRAPSMPSQGLFKAPSGV